ncbi:hypothetical protein [Leptodesmis sichuanensis]|uniref:hypothetical protein n=1 Tax=Leptodesmis sichuanensis TaxID=2906798 RepID=UPI001F41E328|nr:hypothetical protein [Leptodesmis sichuanensis]UIE40159.1 hypothetical protein KIK02_11830 [Leptodesmis sichuanensis A121]
MTGLKANHICQAIRRVLGALAARNNVKEFRPTSLSLDIRTFSYNEHERVVGVTLIGGRHKFKLSIGGYQIALLRSGDGTLGGCCKHS